MGNNKNRAAWGNLERDAKTEQNYKILSNKLPKYRKDFLISRDQE